MSHTVFKLNRQFGARRGLEGPYHYANGRVLYYDAKEGQYWDPTTDWYVPNDELAALQQQIFDRVRG